MASTVPTGNLLSEMLCGHVLRGLQAQGRLFRTGLEQTTLLARGLYKSAGGLGQPTGKAQSGGWDTLLVGCRWKQLQCLAPGHCTVWILVD